MQKSDIIQPAAMLAPIAVEGDKNIPNYEASGADTSCIKEGFLPITSEPLDENGQAPERTDFNGMFYLATDFRVFLQQGSPITFNDSVSTAIGGYPEDAILTCITSNGLYGFVKSLHDNNQENFITDPTKINNTDWTYLPLITPNSTELGSALSLQDRGSNYIQLGDGTLIQWGTNSTNNHYRTVNLYKKYSAYTSYRVMLTDTGASTGIADFKVINKTDSTFRVYTTSSGSEDTFDWFAIGR